MARCSSVCGNGSVLFGDCSQARCCETPTIVLCLVDYQVEKVPRNAEAYTDNAGTMLGFKSVTAPPRKQYDG